MSGTIRNVFFILKSIEISDIFQRFSVFLKIENYDFVKMGDFVSSDLPNGLNFPVLLEDSWFQNPEFEVEIRTEGSIYAGILEIGEEKEYFSISGSTTVYNCRNPADHLQLECTILIENPATTVIPEEKSTVTRETQTEKEKEPEKKQKIARDRETQTLPPPTPSPLPETSESSTMTVEPHLNLDDLEPLLTATIARHLKEHRESKNSESQNPTSEDVVEDPMPSRGAPTTFNLMPRIAKLRDLDKIIKQKEEILEKLNMEIETKRKIQKIRESRVDSDGKKILKSEDVAFEDKHPVEVLVDSESKVEKDPSETSESTTSTTSTSTSESDSSDSESESSESSTSSESSSSKETVRALLAVPQKSDGESTIEDPFSSRQKEETEPEPPEENPISPTTAYINNLRQNMLNQYLQKYN